MQNPVRPDYISFFDPTVEYYTVDAIQYLPKERRKELQEKEEREKSNNQTDSSSLLS